MYTYDTLGRRISSTYEDNVVRSNSYDQANRLTKVSDATGTASPSLASMDGVPLVGNFDGDSEDDVFFYRSTSTANDDYVFWGAARDQFGSVNGNFSVGSGYVPATGDFNCDGKDDILWYKPGSGSDYVWFWFGRYDTSSSSGDYTSKAFAITDSFVPVTGDFNGDSCADILWYAAGSATDAFWWGDDDVAIGTNQFDLGGASVGGSFQPVAGDFDGNGADDVFWYAPGTAQDYLWMFDATGGTYSSVNRTVNTSGYGLATGDVDGGGMDDLLFSNPSGTDYLWWGAAEASFGSSNQKTLPAIDSGNTPVMGDFDGDGKADLFLYKGAASGDTIWWGAADADFGTSTGGTGFQNTTTAHESKYTYDADGIRASKEVDGGTAQKYTYSTGTGLPLLLTETKGTDTTYLIYGPGGQPIEQINPDGTAVWLHHDQLGSVRLATKATDGSEQSHRTFDAYGTVATQSAAPTPQPKLGYAGQYTDAETGYQYLRARYYDPATGLFLTVDPLVNRTAEPYGYGGANPVTWVDPSGMCHRGFDCPEDYGGGVETNGGMTMTGPSVTVAPCDDPPPSNPGGGTFDANGNLVRPGEIGSRHTSGGSGDDYTPPFSATDVMSCLSGGAAGALTVIGLLTLTLLAPEVVLAAEVVGAAAGCASSVANENYSGGPDGNPIDGIPTPLGG